MRKGHIFLQMTGHRKPTARYCFRCKAAGLDPWHATHRAIGDPDCPLEEQQTRAKSPAFIAPHKLGITKGRPRLPKTIQLNMRDIIPENVPSADE